MGKNLVAQLRNEGWNDLLLFDVDTPKELLADYAARADFVFHLAGVNRPQNPDEFYEGNRGFTEHLLALLAAAGNKAPVLVTSSIQAELDNDYGKSKREAEELIFAHERATGAPALVYRLPGRVRQMVPPVLQQRCGHVLPQHRKRPAHRRAGPCIQLPSGIHRRRGGQLHRRDGGACRAGLFHSRLLPSDVRRL